MELCNQTDYILTKERQAGDHMDGGTDTQLDHKIVIIKFRTVEIKHKKEKHRSEI